MTENRNVLLFLAGGASRSVLIDIRGAPFIVGWLIAKSNLLLKTFDFGPLDSLSVRDLLRLTSVFEREYATKEEWVRESMLARQRLEKLTEIVTRIETELENGQGMAAELGRATAAMVEMVRCWTERGGRESEK